MNFSRRDFTKMILGAAAVGLVESSTVAKIFGQTKRSMLWLSAQTASGEGRWTNLKIEGKLPKDLNGTLFRTAPGQSENFGVTLNHLFDGDAYLSSWRFRDGKVELTGRFLPTPGRLKELEAKKMLHSEFGTRVENSIGGKSQPSVNVIEWNGKLLGLSEGSLPRIIDPKNFDYLGIEDFGGTIPKDFSFTAHPRFNPKTGDMFAWSSENRPPGNVHLFQISKQTNRATKLYTVPTMGAFMLHDAVMTENYFVLPIPPMQYDFMKMMSGKFRPGEALGFNEKLPTRLLILPLDNKGGTAKPIEVEMPPEIIFHYGNAHETADGKIVFEMVSGNDKTLFETLREWKKNPYIQRNTIPQVLRQITIDVANKKVLSRTDLHPEVEFPRYDMRLTGQKTRYLYATEAVFGENAAVIRVDLQTNKVKKVSGSKNRTLGEPVFVPKTEKIDEERGWILAQGYDADKNETFLEIKDAQTLEFKARIWANGQHFPIGFHGNFYAGV